MSSYHRNIITTPRHAKGLNMVRPFMPLKVETKTISTEKCFHLGMKSCLCVRVLMVLEVIKVSS